MYQKKDYKTLRTLSNMISGFGWVIIIILFIAGWIGGGQQVGVIGGFFAGLLSGLIIGIPLVALGQLISVFLDQKEVQEEILATINSKTSSK